MLTPLITDDHSVSGSHPTRIVEGAGRVSVGRASTFAVGTNVIQLAGGFVGTALLARLLGPAQKGVYDLYIATSMLLSVLLSLALNAGVTYTVASQPVNTSRLMRVLALIGLGEAGAVFGVMYLADFFGRRSSLVPPEMGSAGVLAVACTVLLVSVSTFYRAVLVGHREFIKANHGDVVKQALGIGFLAIIFAMSTRTHLNPLTWAVVANMATVGITIAAYGSRVPAGNSVGNDIGLSRAFRFALPAYFANASQYVNNRIDLYFVYHYHGTADVGLYQTAGLIGQAISLLPSAVQGILFPTIASGKYSPEETIATVARTHRLLFTLALVAALAVGTSGFVVIPLVFGKAFAPSAVSLAILAPGCAVSVTTTVLAAYFGGTGRPHINLLNSLIGTIVTVILDFLVVPKWGFYGASVVSVLSYVIGSLCSLFVFKRETGVKLADLYIVSRSDLALSAGYCREAMKRLRQEAK